MPGLIFSHIRDFEQVRDPVKFRNDLFPDRHQLGTARLTKAI